MLDTISPNFLLVSKPVGWTSFDVVNYIRKEARAKTGNKNIKVGHAGTLDPFATGLLIVGIGREATKRLDEFKGMKKTYVATIHLGAVSDTQDVTGIITPYISAVIPTSQEESLLVHQPTEISPPGRDDILPLEIVNTALKTFVGTQLQTPPMHSAKKIGGQRLYTLARQGKEVERQPNKIEIYEIKLLGYNWPLLKIEVSCSPGTYIRTLAYDIGEKLGVGAYCEALERTRIGTFTLEQATTVDNFKLEDVQ